MEDQIRFHSATGPPHRLIPLDETLRDITDFRFPCLYRECICKLIALDVPVPENTQPTAKDLQRIADALRSFPPDRSDGAAHALLQRMRMLLRLQTAIVCEDFAAFREEAEMVAGSSKQAAMALASDGGFKELRRIAERYQKTHPRALQTWESVRESLEQKRATVIFADRERSALFLLALFREHQVAADLILAEGAGHTALSETIHINRCLEELERRSLQVLLCSSALQARVFGKAERYIQYAVPNPFAQQKLLAARVQHGWNSRLAQLVMDHPLDRTLYWKAYYSGSFPAAFRSEHKPKKIEAPAQPLPPPKPKPKKYKGKGRPNTGQFNLFD